MLSGSNLHLLYGEDRWGHPGEDSTGGEEMLFLTGGNQSLGNEPLLFPLGHFPVGQDPWGPLAREPPS